MLLFHQLKRRVILTLFALSLALSLAVGSPWDNRRAVAQDSAPESARAQVQQGVEQYQSGNFQSAIALWETALETYQDTGQMENQAIVAENLARAHQRLGDSESALPYWEQAARVQGQLGNRQKLGRMLTEQAQTYARLGQYRQAVGQLCGFEANCSTDSAVGIARDTEDRSGEAAALGSLGEAYRLQGSYESAEARLAESLVIATEIGDSAYVAAAANSLGSVYRQRSRISDRRAEEALQRGDNLDARRLQEAASDENQTALDYFEQSLAAARGELDLAAASGESDEIRALLNLIPTYHRAGQMSAAQTSHAQAVALLNQVPPSRTKAYATIDLADLRPLLQADIRREALAGAACPSDQPQRPQTEALLQQAIATAKQINDYRAQSFAYGKLGHLYECDGSYERALSSTQDAEWAADQALKSRDSLYLWQWQTGRILKAQGETAEAIAAYEAAVDTLEKIRSDILTADRDLQFDFRDAVEPVYRQLAELRLTLAPIDQMVVPAKDSTDNISAALTTIDSLKLAELQNYFGDECIILASIDTKEAADAASATYPNTGIFSTFITDNRTAVVLTLPEGRRVAWLPVSQETIYQEVNDFRIGLERSLFQFEAYDPTEAAGLYDRLIRPFTADLDASGVDTLVFVQDGIFRSVPMAALYDGEQYLIQRYAIATTPSLSLTPLTPRPRRRLRALALGLSEPATVDGQDFPPLTGVDQELDQIEQRLPGSRSLLNEDFTLANLETELQENEYSIVHMATHGEFGAEPQNTFLVTGDSVTAGNNREKQKLTIGQLEAALRQSGGTQQIDLLTLTACKTAIGDTRATLGLAGVAVQAGARSAIASLWSIDDVSTAAIVDSFYQALSNPDLTKAQALREAQLAAIGSDRIAQPGFWAPFLLIGDWQ
ncbi:MAG: CHAT domain-containing protein [Elainellaceae cyanobacterium]